MPTPADGAPQSPGVGRSTDEVPPGKTASMRAGEPPNLQLRVLSSIVMIAVAVLALWAGVVPFGLLVLAVAVILSWEWGQVVRGVAADSGFLIHAGAVTAAVFIALIGAPLLALAALVAGAIVLVGGSQGDHPLLSAAGVGYAGGAALSLIWFRGDAALGTAAVLFLFMVVWVNDTMAFVVGRRIGKAKLWPSISPNKTWAGFIGGIVSSGLAALLFSHAIPGASAVRLAILGVVLAAVAVAGDLAESALKRRFGVKDTSAIIPGHGGVMDRMDGIVAVAGAAAVLALVTAGRSPASSLLIGG